MMICHVKSLVQSLPSHTALHDDFHVALFVLAHRTCVCVYVCVFGMYLDCFTASLLDETVSLLHLLPKWWGHRSPIILLKRVRMEVIHLWSFVLSPQCDSSLVCRQRRPLDPSSVSFVYTTAGVCRCDTRDDTVCSSTPNPIELQLVLNYH